MNCRGVLKECRGLTGCSGTPLCRQKIRKRYFAQSLRYPAEPHEPSVLSPRPGGSRTQVTDPEASGLASSELGNKGERQCLKCSKARSLSSPHGQEGLAWPRQSFSAKRVPMASSQA